MIWPLYGYEFLRIWKFFSDNYGSSEPKGESTQKSLIWAKRIYASLKGQNGLWKIKFSLKPHSYKYFEAP